MSGIFIQEFEGTGANIDVNLGVIEVHKLHAGVVLEVGNHFEDLLIADVIFRG